MQSVSEPPVHTGDRVFKSPANDKERELTLTDTKNMHGQYHSTPRGLRSHHNFREGSRIENGAHQKYPAPADDSSVLKA